MTLDLKDRKIDDDIDREIEKILSEPNATPKIPQEMTERFLKERRKRERPLISSGEIAHGPA
jgi:hypothetical protein